MLFGQSHILYSIFLAIIKPDKRFSPSKRVKNINSKGNETILIVDDEPSLLNLSCEILNQQGYNTIYAENGRQALEILKTEAIDLLFSDVIMPE